MQRQIWIDVLKGIGIACVVLCHSTNSPMTVEIIFMFNMPLFFLLGGWLHRDTMPQREFLRNQARNLLLPYVSYLLILWPLELLAAFPDQTWDRVFILRELLKPMVLGGPLLKGYAAVFWFVTCYFLVQQLVHYVVRQYSRQQALLIFSTLLVCAYLQAWLLPLSWLPWNVHTVLFAAPLYYCGYRSREVDFQKYRVALCLVAAAGVALNLSGVHNRLDLKYLDYGFPLVTLVSAVACSAVLALVAQLLATSRAGSLLAALGGASLTIMFIHQFIQLGMAKQLGLGSVPLRVVVSLLLGWGLHRLWLWWPLLGKFFIGTRAKGTRLSSASLVTGA